MAIVQDGAWVAGYRGASPPDLEHGLHVLPTLLRAADRLAAPLGLLDRPLSADRLIARARRRTGLTDFGDDSFQEPLRVFLDSCARESSLGVFGRFATEWDVVRFLSNLLRLRAAEDADPSIAGRRIRKPIFITGLPRSGTTFLHQLMMADPDNRAPMVWETIFPSAEDGDAATRAATVDRQLRAFARIAPEFAGLHPIEARSPQECSDITAHVFRSLRLDTNYLVPAYRAWLDADAALHLPAYRFHRRFLRHLAPQPPHEGRWVLKCPDHLFALGALRAVYPDARLVFVHRDPIKVMASVAHLTEVLRQPFMRHIDRARIGRDDSARWVDGTRRMIQAADEAAFQEPICHVHHLDLIRDPAGSVGTVYRHFGMDQPDDLPRAIAAFVAAKPNGGYRHAAYRFQDHGLEEATEREKFRPYMEHFQIEPETAWTGFDRPRGNLAGASLAGA